MQGAGARKYGFDAVRRSLATYLALFAALFLLRGITATGPNISHLLVLVLITKTSEIAPQLASSRKQGTHSLLRGRLLGCLRGLFFLFHGLLGRCLLLRLLVFLIIIVVVVPVIKLDLSNLFREVLAGFFIFSFLGGLLHQ